MHVRRWWVLAAGSALALAGAVGSQAFLGSAAAQAATGSVTGRVLWSGCFGGPLPRGAASGSEPSTGTGTAVPMPGAAIGNPSTGGAATPPAGADQSTPSAPGAQPAMPVPGPVYPYRVIPAGAVLVAAQGTSASTRTDENGAFTLGNVPSGQYLTIAAGPVSFAGDAWTARPNVMVNGGQTLDLGTMWLGVARGAGVVCGPYPAAGGVGSGPATALPNVPPAPAP